jgi:peptidoglycan/xylan/chitin deacetylase (PgdA/CDA1 family)
MTFSMFSHRLLSCRHLNSGNHCLVFLLTLVGLVLPVSVSYAGESAVVLMYHRFGDDRYPTTNIKIKQFEAHIAELGRGTYMVLPVPEILRRQRAGEVLPARTVGITIDDAYTSVYLEAWPRLRDAGFPFTLFVSTDPIDGVYDDMMTWDQLREMAAAGVTIGAHTGSHLHMPAHTDQRNRDEVQRSNARFLEELGKLPTLFAYPYGESGSAAATVVEEAGYIAAFGQHSGAFSTMDNQFDLPRFPLNEKFGDMGRFMTAINALALPVADPSPENTIIMEPNPPAMGFTLLRPMKRAAEISCFLSHEGKAGIEILGDVRIEIRVETPFVEGRTRLNCTMPGWGNDAGRWYWFGRQFYVGKSG